MFDLFSAFTSRSRSSSQPPIPKNNSYGNNSYTNNAENHSINYPQPNTGEYSFNSRKTNIPHLPPIGSYNPSLGNRDPTIQHDRQHAAYSNCNVIPAEMTNNYAGNNDVSMQNMYNLSSTQNYRRNGNHYPNNAQVMQNLNNPYGTINHATHNPPSDNFQQALQRRYVPKPISNQQMLSCTLPNRSMKINPPIQYSSNSMMRQPMNPSVFPPNPQFNLSQTGHHSRIPSSCMPYNPSGMQSNQMIDYMNISYAPGTFYATKQMLKPSQLLPMRLIGDVILKDVQMGKFLGQGGPVRLFLLGEQIKHEFESLDEETWEREKQFLRDTTQIPIYSSPILMHDNITLFDSMSILRYLSKKMGQYGCDHLKDFVMDAVTSGLFEWRSSLMKAAEVVMDECTESYSQILDYFNDRSSYFSKYDELLDSYIKKMKEMKQQQLISVSNKESENKEDKFFTGSKPSFCDYVIFDIIYNDQKLIENVDEVAFRAPNNYLADCPRLQALYNELKMHPYIEQYLSELEESNATKDENSSTSENPEINAVENSQTNPTNECVTTIDPSNMSQCVVYPSEMFVNNPYQNQVSYPYMVPQQMQYFPQKLYGGSPVFDPMNMTYSAYAPNQQFNPAMYQQMPMQSEYPFYQSYNKMQMQTGMGMAHNTSGYQFASNANKDDQPVITTTASTAHADDNILTQVQ